MKTDLINLITTDGLHLEIANFYKILCDTSLPVWAYNLYQVIGIDFRHCLISSCFVTDDKLYLHHAVCFLCVSVQ